MNRGSLLAAWIVGATVWGAAMLAIWSMADPVFPDDLTNALAPEIAAEAIRDNSRYVETGLIEGMATPLAPARSHMHRPDPAAPFAVPSLPGAGT